MQNSDDYPSLFISHPGLKREILHTVTVKCNPKRDSFKGPDFAVLEICFRGVSPAHRAFLRIAPFIWEAPVARFVLHAPASQRWKAGQREQQRKLDYREREKTCTERSNRRLSSSCFQPPCEAHSPFCP